VRRFVMAGMFVALVCCVAGTPEARAWGCEGHQTIALIAEMHLSPRALAAVNELLKDNPIDPKLNRYCKPVSTDPMADAATWADDYRNQDPTTGPWHFFDIPRGAKRKDIDQYCPASTSCVTAALQAQIAILESPTASAAKKAEALRYVIHFAGDIHQPLHCTTNSDQGGNCVPVSYFDMPAKETNPTTGSYYPRLHAVWDTNILERIAQGKTVEQFAAQLNQQFGFMIASWQRQGMIFDNWAWESHQLAEQISYGDLPVKIAIEPPVAVTTCLDDNHISDRMFKLNEQLGQPYQDDAAPVVEEQLAKAGIRLSMILNKIWP